MKYLFSILLIFVLVSCSAPKYAYRFPSSTVPLADKIMVEDHQLPDPAELESNLVASADPNAFIVPQKNSLKFPDQAKSDRPATKTMNGLKKTAQKAREEIRSLVVPDPASLDEDLKLAILFGVVGMVSIILLILSKLFGIIGGIALIIATVYFVKWILTQ